VFFRPFLRKMPLISLNFSFFGLWVHNLERFIHPRGTPVLIPLSFFFPCRRVLDLFFVRLHSPRQPEIPSQTVLPRPSSLLFPSRSLASSVLANPSVQETTCGYWESNCLQSSLFLWPGVRSLFLRCRARFFVTVERLPNRFRCFVPPLVSLGQA